MLRRLTIPMLAIAMLPLLISSCSRAGDLPRRAESDAIAQHDEATPSEQQLANATYQGIQPQPIWLSEGIWEGEPYVEGSAARPRVEMHASGIRHGDLDGDGRTEAVVPMTDLAAGTGSHLYLAVMEEDPGQVRNVATVRVGDRVQVRRLAVKGEHIVLETIEAGPDDAMCCPTSERERVYRLEGGTLEGSMRELGEISPADLVGTTWRLTHLDWEEPLPAGIEASVSFRVDAIHGSSGCNAFGAPMKTVGPQSIEVGPISITRRACPPPRMEIEHALLERLRDVDRFSFLMEALVLSYDHEGELGALLLERQPQENAPPPDPETDAGVGR